MQELDHPNKNCNAGLSPEEHEEKEAVNEVNSLYEIQFQDKEAFPALLVCVLGLSLDCLYSGLQYIIILFQWIMKENLSFSQLKYYLICFALPVESVMYYGT